MKYMGSKKYIGNSHSNEIGMFSQLPNPILEHDAQDGMGHALSRPTKMGYTPISRWTLAHGPRDGRYPPTPKRKRAPSDSRDKSPSWQS